MCLINDLALQAISLAFQSLPTLGKRVWFQTTYHTRRIEENYIYVSEDHSVQGEKYYMVALFNIYCLSL